MISWPDKTILSNPYVSYPHFLCYTRAQVIPVSCKSYCLQVKNHNHNNTNCAQTPNVIMCSPVQCPPFHIWATMLLLWSLPSSRTCALMTAGHARLSLPCNGPPLITLLPLSLPCLLSCSAPHPLPFIIPSYLIHLLPYISWAPFFSSHPSLSLFSGNDLIRAGYWDWGVHALYKWCHKCGEKTKGNRWDR